MNAIPKRLKKEPLIEAVWQVQFESPNAGDALPGVLYAKLRQTHSEIKLHRLPIADIPTAITQIDPNLRYAAKVRLESPNTPFLWQVGDRVVTLNCRKPYVGWHNFREAILDLIQTIKNSSLVPQPQKHSLRYIDLLTLHPPCDLAALQLSIQIGKHPIRNMPVKTRIELAEEQYTNVIQIATPAKVQLPDGKQEGSVIDLETFGPSPLQNWDEVCSQLDPMHDRSKQLFFEHVLTPDAIQALEPEY